MLLSRVRPTKQLNVEEDLLYCLVRYAASGTPSALPRYSQCVWDPVTVLQVCIGGCERRDTSNQMNAFNGSDVDCVAVEWIIASLLVAATHLQEYRAPGHMGDQCKSLQYSIQLVHARKPTPAAVPPTGSRSGPVPAKHTCKHSSKHTCLVSRTTTTCLNVSPGRNLLEA